MTTSTLNLRAEEQIQELLRELQTDPQKGLSDTVACDRLRLHGPNQLLVPCGVPPLLVLWAELRRTTTILLLSAVAISAFVGAVTATALLVVVSILDCAIRFCKRCKAEKAAEVLSNLTSPVAQVIRSGRLVPMQSVHLVPGDVVRLRTGDCIPADGRLIEALNLSTQEAVLTGEPAPIRKNALHLDDPSRPVEDRRSAVFMGTSVAAGRGTMIVVKTGQLTELGTSLRG